LTADAAGFEVAEFRADAAASIWAAAELDGVAEGSAVATAGFPAAGWTAGACACVEPALAWAAAGAVETTAGAIAAAPDCLTAIYPPVAAAMAHTTKRMMIVSVLDILPLPRTLYSRAASPVPSARRQISPEHRFLS